MIPTKEKLLIAAVAVLLVVAGYAGGRYMTPAKVVTTEHVTYQDHEVTHTVVDTQKILDALATLNRQNDIHVTRVIEKSKDGSEKITETRSDESKTQQTAQAHEDDKQVETKVETKVVYQDREVTKTVVNQMRPTWSLALQPGFQFGDALGGGRSSYDLLRLVPFQHLVGNVVLERRLFGGLMFGAWANTRLDGGLSLRLAW